MPFERRRKKPVLSDAERKRRSEVAKRLHAEGKFGGAGLSNGRGRKKPRFVPRPRELRAALELLERQRDPHASDDVRRLFALVPKDVFRPHRDHMLTLLVGVLESVIKYKQFPRLFVIEGGVITRSYAYKSERPLTATEKWVRIVEPLQNDFQSYCEIEILDLLVLLSNKNTYPCEGPRHVQLWLAEQAELIASAARSEYEAREGTERDANERLKAAV